MSSANEQLIQSLAADCRPVRRLPPPVTRAVLWFGAVLVLAAVVIATANMHLFMVRFAASPEMRYAMAGSTLTAVLAAIATFELSLPDRDGRWALLPLPGLVLWVGASLVGGLRDWVAPTMQVASMEDARGCVVFILAASIPLSLLLLAMLRRARPLRPGPVTLMGGLAVAAAAATLLTFRHEYDDAARDLLMHLGAVALVILGNAAAGRVISGARESKTPTPEPSGHHSGRGG